MNITSLTVSWLNGTNPASVTKYTVELSTVNGFATGTTISSITYSLNGTFINLIPDATYYSRVKALNHYNIPTAYIRAGEHESQSTVHTDELGLQHGNHIFSYCDMDSDNAS